jgi:hypothetical protein
VGLINNQKPDTVKGPFVKFTLAHCLYQGDHKVLLDVERVALDPTDRGARTELVDFIDPLVRQELFVDYDHCSDLKMGRQSQGARRFSESTWKRQDPSTLFGKGSGARTESFWLSRRVT